MAEDDNKNMENGLVYVKELDERILSFIMKIDNAPIIVHQMTKDFTMIIDELKKSFLSSIVQKKVSEKRHEMASVRLDSMRQEYENLLNDVDGYLTQKDDKQKWEAYEQVLKMTTELSIAESAIKSADREYVFHKENLILRSRKEEHNFHEALKKLDDNLWYDIYMDHYSIPIATSKIKDHTSFEDLLLESVGKLTVSAQEASTSTNNINKNENTVYASNLTISTNGSAVEDKRFDHLSEEVSSDMLEVNKKEVDNMSQDDISKKDSKKLSLDFYKDDACQKIENIYDSLPRDDCNENNSLSDYTELREDKKLGSHENVYTSLPGDDKLENEGLTPKANENGSVPPRLKKLLPVPQRKSSNDPDAITKVDNHSETPNIYERINFTDTFYRRPPKPKKTKKKVSLISYFQKRIHGPWEGWDD